MGPGPGGGRPAEGRKGADKGIHGRLYFLEREKTQRTNQVIFSVKAGKVTSSHLRDLRGVLDRENAASGVLISMEEPTRQMRTEAATAGFFESPWGKHPRLQIFTVWDLLQGKKVDGPPARQVSVTFKKAPEARPEKKRGKGLFE